MRSRAARARLPGWVKRHRALSGLPGTAMAAFAKTPTLQPETEQTAQARAGVFRQIE